MAELKTDYGVILCTQAFAKKEGSAGIAGAWIVVENGLRISNGD